MQSVTSRVEFHDVAKGLWIWRAEHHHWKPGDDWQPVVTSTFVESGGERLVIDPLVPKAGAEELWKRLDSRPPTMAAVIIPDHVRDIEEFVRRYNVRPFGPRLFWPDDVPKTALASYGSGVRRGMRKERCQHYALCLSFRLSKSSFLTPTVNRCMAAPPM